MSLVAAGVTVIEPEWLAEVAAPLCSFSAPLDEPPPAYSPKMDSVLCWRSVQYGTHLWDLPLASGALPDATRRAACFAAALLSGKVLPSMAGKQCEIGEHTSWLT